MTQPQKLLFICSQNRWRSLTAEHIYTGFPGCEVKSAGTEPGARIRVNKGVIAEHVPRAWTRNKTHQAKAKGEEPDAPLWT